MKIVLFCIAMTSLTVAAADKPTVDGLMQLTKQSFELPFATAVAVVENDQIVYEGYFGYTDIGAKASTHKDSQFYIASVTKPFFALSALLNEHDGKLDTSASLSTLFPAAKFNQIQDQKINTSHLLSHTAGISGEPMVWPLAYTGLHNASLRMRLIKNIRPNHEYPFTQFDYTNVGYTILSIWYENNLGISWQDALVNQVLNPLDMKHSKTSFTQKSTMPYASPYSTTTADPQIPLYLVKQNNTMHAAGGMVSTARDLGRFVIAQLNHGRVDGKQVFPREVIKKSQVALTEVPNPSNRKRTFSREGYAWGWYTGKYQDLKVLHHGGGFAGASAHISFLPEKKLGIVLLNNEGRLGDALNKLVADAIYQHLLGKEGFEEKLKAEIAELKPKFDGFVERVSKSRNARNGKPLLLTLPLNDYAGQYGHPLVGTISIEKHKDTLQVTWGNLHDLAQYYETPDTVRLELVPESGKVMSFKLSENGVVEELTLDGMTFEKI